MRVPALEPWLLSRQAAPMSISDAYRTLGVDSSTTPAEVKRQYRRLSRENHPDLNPELGPEKMKALNEAYEVITEGAPSRQRPSAPRPPPSRERPPWVTDHRDSWDMSSETFSEINYCKKKIWEAASAAGPVRQIFLQAHDGYFFRGGFYVLGNEAAYPVMVEAMRAWNGSYGNGYDTKAIVVSEGNGHAPKTLIWVEGEGMVNEEVPERDDELSRDTQSEWIEKRVMGDAYRPPWRTTRTAWQRHGGGDDVTLEFDRDGGEGEYSGDPLPDFEKAIKVPEVIDVAHMEAPFEVDTLEGRVEGKEGDWLMRGPLGEMWPVDSDVFDQTYSLVDELDEADRDALLEQLEEELMPPKSAHALAAARLLNT